MMQRLQKLLPFFTLIVLFLALTIATPHFLTPINLASVARQTAVINIMALGMTLVIITGGIDLSVGSILAVAGLFGTMAIKGGQPIPVAICIGIAVGLLCGLLNGLMITQLRINPFIVTLGTLEAFAASPSWSRRACRCTASQTHSLSWEMALCSAFPFRYGFWLCARC